MAGPGPVGPEQLPTVRAARAKARAAAWAAGAGPDLGEELRLDFDATITIAHSEKQNAAATWKTFGFHPLRFLDRPDVAGGEALAVLDRALAALPEQARPRPGDPAGPRLLARSDSAGATHAFAVACVERGVEFSFGFPMDARIQGIVDAIPEDCWHPALQTDGEFHDGAWVAEATGMIDLSSWPDGSRLILRKERPHPGAQLTFTDIDGMRVTALLTNTPAGVVPFQAAGLELRHRQPARVEDRIREAKATGLRNLPGVQREPSLARDRAHRGRPDLLDQTDLLRRRGRARPLRNRSVPLPGPPRRRSPHPIRTSATAPDRQDLAVGSPDLRGLRPTPRRIRLTTRDPSHDPRNPETRSPAAPVGQPVMPTTGPTHSPRHSTPDRRHQALT